MFLENASCVLQQIDISSCSKADFLDYIAKEKKKKKPKVFLFMCVISNTGYYFISLYHFEVSHDFEF